MRLSFKLLLISEIVLLVAVLALVIPVWHAMGEQVVDNMQNELKAIASTASLAIDGDLHRTIRTMEDADTEAFHTLQARLEQVRQANDIKLNHIYTFYPDGDRMRFAVMLNPSDELFVGEPYPIQDLMRPVLQHGSMEATELYTDEHGQWISAYAPIRDRAGAIVGLLEVDKSAEEYFSAFHDHRRLTIVVGLVALALSSILGWWVLQRLIIRPMTLIREGMIALGRRDFSHRVELSTNDELEELGNTLNGIASQLNVARLVQQGLFPKSLPSHDHYRIAGKSIPCDATGGDYYDAFSLPDGRIAVLVADVSGHGLGSSLLMASCRAALRALSQADLAPGQLCSRLNDILVDELSDGRFITLIYGILEAHGAFTYSNFGHGPALVVRGGRIQHLEAQRPPLGIDLELPGPAQHTVQLQPGDRLFLASDGLVEAMDAERRILGLTAVEDVVADREATSHVVVERLHTLQRDHCGGLSTTDDVTLLCVDRL